MLMSIHQEDAGLNSGVEVVMTLLGPVVRASDIVRPKEDVIMAVWL